MTEIVAKTLEAVDGRPYDDGVFDPLPLKPFRTALNPGAS